MEKEENILTTKSSIKEKNIITSVAGIMAALTVLNIGATYGIVQYNNVKTYGSAENYEKFLTVNNAQYDLMPKIEELKNQIEQMKKMNLGENNSGNDSEKTANESPSGKLSKEDLVANTPIYGKKEAKYSIYEFSDFECPWCQKFHQSSLAKQAVDKNSENLNYIKRNFQFHQGAPMKAQAALCAMDQKGDEGYFKMLDSIFSGTLRENKEDILVMAEKNGLDKTKIDKCLNSSKYAKSLEKDYILGAEKMGVTGTPSVFVVNNETGEFKKLSEQSISEIENIMNSI